MSTIHERYNAAEKLKDSGEVEQAKEMLLAIVADAPEHVLSHLTLARIFTGLGEHDPAFPYSDQAYTF